MALTWLTRPSCALVVSKPSPKVRPTMLAVLRWLHGHGVCTYVEPSAVKELRPQLHVGGKGGAGDSGGGGGGEGGAGESGEWLDAHRGAVDLEQCWDEGLEDMPGCKTGGAGGGGFPGAGMWGKRRLGVSEGAWTEYWRWAAVATRPYNCLPRMEVAMDAAFGRRARPHRLQPC